MMLNPPAPRFFIALALCTLAGCATAKMDTRTHYLSESAPPTPGFPAPREAKPVPTAAPSKKIRHSTRPASALDADAAGSPTLHLRSTPPTLRDRTGAPVPIVPSSSAQPVPASAPVASHERPVGLAGVGDFEIQYVNGVITKVSIRKKTGQRELDRKSKEWILAKFHVRPGATGQSSLTLTWREDRDRPTPQFHSL